MRFNPCDFMLWGTSLILCIFTDCLLFLWYNQICCYFLSFHIKIYLINILVLNSTKVGDVSIFFSWHVFDFFISLTCFFIIIWVTWVLRIFFQVFFLLWYSFHFYLIFFNLFFFFDFILLLPIIHLCKKK